MDDDLSENQLELSSAGIPLVLFSDVVNTIGAFFLMGAFFLIGAFFLMGAYF